ncbi:MAG: hypothetical protein J2P38_02515 [Candidatus Dormibacteraeota bacterium]|nr:hypothetical protein [Candidatus Dormibacteraeota bacterium]
MPILTFRRPVAQVMTQDPQAPDREFAYLVLVPLLAVANLFLGLLVLVLARHATHWKAGVLVLAGGLLCATGGWLAGVTWLRLLWRSRMQRQLRMWAGVVDAVTGWEEEVGISPESALKLKHRLDRLVSRF